MRTLNYTNTYPVDPYSVCILDQVVPNGLQLDCWRVRQKEEGYAAETMAQLVQSTLLWIYRREKWMRNWRSHSVRSWERRSWVMITQEQNLREREEYKEHRAIEKLSNGLVR